jgi:hypothetical protein
MMMIVIVDNSNVDDSNDIDVCKQRNDLKTKKDPPFIHSG